MEDKEMPLVEHLAELRRRLIVAIIVVIFFAALFTFLIIPSNSLGSGGLGFREQILRVLTKPLPEGQKELAVLAPTEAFIVYLKISLLLAALAAIPVILYEAWAFVGVALKPVEKKWIYTYLPVSFVFSVAGVLFAYFLVLPYGLRFLLGLAEGFRMTVAVSRYMSFVTLIVLAFGVIFQLPVAVMFLSSIGLVSHRFLARKRPYAVVLAFVTAAILTPPDVFTQVMMAAPLLLLYEISIGLSWVVTRRRMRAKARELARMGN